MTRQKIFTHRVKKSERVIDVQRRLRGLGFVLTMRWGPKINA